MKQNNHDLELKDMVKRIRTLNEGKSELNKGVELIYDDELESKLGQEGFTQLKNLLNGFIENANSSMRDFYVAHDGNGLTIRTRIILGGNEAEVLIDAYASNPKVIMSDNTLELNNEVIQTLNSVGRFYNAVSDEIKTLSL